MGEEGEREREAAAERDKGRVVRVWRWERRGGSLYRQGKVVAWHGARSGDNDVLAPEEECDGSEQFWAGVG